MQNNPLAVGYAQIHENQSHVRVRGQEPRTQTKFGTCCEKWKQTGKQTNIPPKKIKPIKINKFYVPLYSL